MSFKKTATRAAAGAVAGLLPAAQANAADITIRLAHLNPEGRFASHSDAMSAVFKSLVESNANGRIECSSSPTASSARTTR